MWNYLNFLIQSFTYPRKFNSIANIFENVFTQKMPKISRQIKYVDQRYILNFLQFAKNLEFKQFATSFVWWKLFKS